MHYQYDHNYYNDKFLKFALTKSLHRGIHNIRHTVARGSILKVSLFCSLQYSVGHINTRKRLPGRCQEFKMDFGPRNVESKCYLFTNGGVKCPQQQTF